MYYVECLLYLLHAFSMHLSQFYPPLFAFQLSQHSALVQQLHSADRESLLAEIRALRATLDSMRKEQRQQVQYLYTLHVYVHAVYVHTCD